VALITVAAFSGLRWGELAGLRRCDVDLAAGTVRVSRKFGALKSGREFGLPKSAAGIRVVALPAVARKALTGDLDEFTGTNPEALAFTGDKDIALAERQLPAGGEVVEVAGRRGDASGISLPCPEAHRQQHRSGERRQHVGTDAPDGSREQACGVDLPARDE
jgi:hypothetical protein